MNEPETSSCFSAIPVPRDHVPGYVYFLTCEHPDFPVKIGFASKIKPRLTQLAVVMPYKVILLASMPGSRRSERRMHIHFKADRLRGEWFRRSSQVLEGIERIKAGEPPWGAEAERLLQEHTQAIIKRAHML